MSIGLFVEGPSDRDSLGILARRILPARGASVGVLAKPVRNTGDLLDATKMAAHINVLSHTHSDVSRVIVCVDSECTPAEEALARTAQVKERLEKAGIGVPVAYVVAVHALEGWLVADHETVRDVIGARGDVNLPQRLDDVCRPSKLLEDLFSKHGRSYYKTRRNPLIAERANLEQLAWRNSSFTDFLRAVEGPQDSGGCSSGSSGFTS